MKSEVVKLSNTIILTSGQQEHSDITRGHVDAWAMAEVLAITTLPCWCYSPYCLPPHTGLASNICSWSFGLFCFFRGVHQLGQHGIPAKDLHTIIIIMPVHTYIQRPFIYLKYTLLFLLWRNCKPQWSLLCALVVELVILDYKVLCSLSKISSFYTFWWR